MVEHDNDEPDPSRILTRSDFARELTLAKERAGLTVRDVAKALGAQVSTVGGYFGGRHLPRLTDPNPLADLLYVCGITDPDDIVAWEQALSRVRRSPGRRSSNTPVPYRGLSSFQPEDADWFFGRERLTELLMDRLAGTAAAGGLLFVVGPSGSGKSSLLRAGMIPSLAGGRLPVPGSENWPYVLMTPGEHPLEELTAAVRAADYVVLVVDQFEEVFTACADEAERLAFIDSLAEMATAGTETALVVIGLRADFYPHVLRCERLVSALQNNQVVVGPMNSAELRSAIVRPAVRAKLDLEESLVELLLRDLMPAGAESGSRLAHDVGALPLLSHALLATWERGHRRRLTTADYRDSGGFRGAVGRTADTVYEGLTPTQRNQARQTFTRLVHVADDTGDTRRRISREELLLDDRDAPAMLERFIEQRLITVDMDQVEITHEALLTAWPLLRGWIDADRAGLRTHRQLTITAEAWRDGGGDPNVLYRGVRLAAARDWAAEPRHRADLNLLERDFLDACVELEQAEVLAVRRRARHLRGLLMALTALTVAAGMFAGYAYLQRRSADRTRDLAVSRQVAIEADKLRSTDVALAAQLSLAAYRIAKTPEARSSLLDSYATPMATRMPGISGVLQSVAIRSDQRVLAAAGVDRRIRLWNLADPGRPVAFGDALAGHSGTIFSVAFSPDGRLLATGSADRTVRLWDVSDPGHATLAAAPLTGAASTLYSLAFSPDGRTLAAGSADKTVRLWDLTDRQHPTPLGGALTGAGGSIQTVAFSPDGRTLAAGSADTTIRLWDVTDRRHPLPLGRPLIGAAKTVFSVAFSPNGRMLAAGSADDSVRLWNVTDPGHPVQAGAPLTGPASFVNGVGFSPDGRDLAAASSDGKVWIWDSVSRMLVSALPHPGPVTSVAFGRDGRTLATGSADGVARLWELSGPVIAGHGQPVFGTVFSGRTHLLANAAADSTVQVWNVADPRRPVQFGPTLTNAARSVRATGVVGVRPDGRVLAVGAIDGTVQLWDISDPARPVALPTRLTGPTGAVEGANFSPDGRILAISDDDSSVRLWDLSDPRRPARLGAPLTGPKNYAYGAAFSPDGRTLGYGTADGSVWLWDISVPAHAAVLRPPLTIADRGYVFTVAFSPDGRTLAVSGADNEVRLWNVTDRHRPLPLGRPLGGPGNYVFSLAFSSDGRTLAASSGDGTTWLWNVSDPGRPTVTATLTGSPGAVYDNAFETGRPILATSSADGTIRLWNVDVGQVTTAICARSGAAITRAEWSTYISGRPYAPPC